MWLGARVSLVMDIGRDLLLQSGYTYTYTVRFTDAHDSPDEHVVQWSV